MLRAKMSTAEVNFEIASDNSGASQRLKIPVALFVSRRILSGQQKSTGIEKLEGHKFPWILPSSS